MTRKCSKCRRVKHITAFYVARYDENKRPLAYKAHCIVCQKENANKWRRGRQESTDPVDHEANVMLDPAPFRAWLLDRLHSVCGGEPGRLARDLEVDDRRLYAWLHTAKRVHIDMVDRALLNAGWMLVDVYPELYVWDDEQMDLGVAA